MKLLISRNDHDKFTFLGLMGVTQMVYGLKRLVDPCVYGHLSYFCSLQDLGVFIPPMTQGIRTDFFQESPFLPTRMKPDRETLGGLADMFGQMPGMS